MAQKSKFSITKLKNKQVIYWLIIITGVCLTYGHWLTVGNHSWGDWGWWSKEALKNWQYLHVWWSQEGLGRSFFDLGSATWAPFFRIAGLLANLFGFGWPAIEKLLWFGPFMIFAVISMPFFWHTFFPQDQNGWFAASLIYNFNSYIFLLAMGGYISENNRFDLHEGVDQVRQILNGLIRATEKLM